MSAVFETSAGGRPLVAPAPVVALRPMRIAVVVATVGRAATARKMIDSLAAQTRPPDRILAVGAGPSDVAGLDEAKGSTETYLSTRGLCCQRNRGLGILAGEADLIVFFDDDFTPAITYLAEAERLFVEQPDVVGATGRVIADGANGPGFSFEDAQSLLTKDASELERSGTRPRRALYGCNMVIRASAIGDLRFDETLPLYGWQEDIDFSYRLGHGGRLLKSDALAGVHMGEKAGRTSGVRLGYSQIANPVYLLRKGSVPRDLAWRVMRNNFVSNLWKSIAPESYIDRRGRLKGNLVALVDLVRGQIHPRRIFAMK